jgi:hypothetical protein
MEVARMFLVFGHLLALVAAAAAVAFGDYALLGQRRINVKMLHQSSRVVAWALLALYLTGGGIIWVDTHFDLAVLMAKPKILAKLSVVALLTLNGALLHARVLPLLSKTYPRRRDASRVASLATQAGAISAACWGFALFLGVAKPLTPILGYAGFMALFAAAIVGALVVAWKVVFPQLTQRVAGVSYTHKPVAAPEPFEDRRYA